MQKYVKKTILSISCFLFLGIFFYSNLLVVPVSCDDENYILEIPKNASANLVSNILEDNICLNASLFKLAIYATFNQKKIKPGLYSLKKNNTLGELIRDITTVSKNKKRITVLEGSNIYDIAEYLSNELNINKQKFINLCLNEEYIKSLKMPYNLKTLEGFLFPDTYVLLDTYTEKDIIEILVNRFINMYELNIHLDLSKTKLNIFEIITLASIIQGEAMLIEEMPTISSVYHNRLKRKMKLEADPTILYYMTSEDLTLFKDEPGSSESSRVFRKYKNIDNPYNTYAMQGLPVGPINNPGLQAIQAALYPENSDKNYLYFVADGSGGHIFSKTLKQHNRAIRKIRSGY